MKDMIAALAASALPTLMVLIGILLNRNDVNRLDGRISSLEASLRGEVGGIRGEVSGHIAALRGELSGIRNEIAGFRNQTHSDLQMLNGAGNETDKRVTRLEEKTFGFGL